MFIGATSRIQPTPALLEAWATLRLDPSVRAVQIQVKGEALELVQTLPKQGSVRQDFGLLRAQEGLLAPSEASFLLFALLDGADAGGADAAPPPSWALVSYIPVGAPVRQKMLYSSSLQGLKQALGPFCGVYSADEEASYEGLVEKTSVSSGGSSIRAGGVVQQLKGVQTWGGGGRGGGAAAAAEDAPLMELEKLKLAERHLEKDSRVRLPGLKAGAPFTLHEDVRTALRALASGLEGPGVGLLNWLELRVHADEQAVRLAVPPKAVPSLLALAAGSVAGVAEGEIAALIEPVQARFYVVAARHASSDDGNAVRTLFLYFCPAEAPVREKMGFSVQKKTAVEQVEAVLGRPFAAVLEAQEMGDAVSMVVDAVIESAAKGAEGAASEEAGAAAAARPRAPGRRGASTRVRALLAKDDDDDDEP